MSILTLTRKADNESDRGVKIQGWLEERRTGLDLCVCVFFFQFVLLKQEFIGS